MNLFGDELWETPYTAEVLNLEPDTLVMWRHRGVGPAYLKIGRRVYYKATAVRAWIEATCNVNPGEKKVA